MLLEKTHRFSELAHRIGGVSERMLAHSLRALEADGFVARVVHPTKPPKVEYSLTQLGQELAVPIQALTSWVEANVWRVLDHRQSRVAAPTIRKTEGLPVHSHLGNAIETTSEVLAKARTPENRPNHASA